MRATTEAQWAHRARTEQAAMDALAERLATQFPELPTEVIVSKIRAEFNSFEGSPIRDFVSVLVERAVRDDLAHPAPA